jgi:SAM-dependent methyltransferase
VTDQPGLAFEDEISRRIEAAYLTSDAVRQRARTRELLAVSPGDQVLDVGCGPGLLAAELAAEAGTGGRVVGIDLSESMLALAGKRETATGSAPIELLSADAAELPFDDGTFDRAAITQVYEYVGDTPKALAELRRVLRPGGRALILDTDFHSLFLATTDDERMTRVMAAWDRHAAHPELPRHLPGLLHDAGLDLIELDAITFGEFELDETKFAWAYLDFISEFVRAVGVEPEDADAWLAEQRERAAGGHFFFSLNRYLFLAERPSG